MKTPNLYPNYGTFYHNSPSDIRHYLHALQPNPKEKDKYSCPCCHGHNLSINSATGQFNCFNGCTPTDVFIETKKLAGEWKEGKAKGRKLNHYPSTKRAYSKASQTKNTTALQENIQIATLPGIPTNIPQPQQPGWIPPEVIRKTAKVSVRKEDIEEIIYPYSPTQWISRFQWQDSSQLKGTDKSFCYGCINPEDGSVKRTKGEQHWQPYRFNEALEYGQGQGVLVLEGEKCVEAVRGKGVVGISFPSGRISQEDLSQLKQNNISLVIVTDNDETGRKQADYIQQAYADIGGTSIVIDIKSLWANCPEKGDIADWMERDKEKVF